MTIDRAGPRPGGPPESWSRRRRGDARSDSLRAAVALLVVVAFGAARAPEAAAQFASVDVSAQVMAPDRPAVPALVATALAAAASPVPDGWTEQAPVDRRWVTRTRLRNEPRTGQPGAGLVLDVVLDYIAN